MEVRWVPPDPEWHKMNFVGVFSQTTKRGSSATVLRIEDNIVAAVAKPLKTTSTCYAECEACRMGITMVKL